MTITKENFKTILVVALVGVCGILGWFLWSSHQSTKGDPGAVPTDTLVPAQKYPVKTEVSAVGKQQTTDPDVKLNQTYTADINGQQVKVPVTKGTALGTTGVIKQEVDLTPVVDMAMRITRETYGRGNWEVSTGLGREQNHWYIPVELKRNYNKDESLSLELHIAPTEDKRLSGGELKYGRKFN